MLSWLRWEVQRLPLLKIWWHERQLQCLVALASSLTGFCASCRVCSMRMLVGLCRTLEKVPKEVSTDVLALAHVHLHHFVRPIRQLQSA